jgi:hypothetical protein
MAVGGIYFINTRRASTPQSIPSNQTAAVSPATIPTTPQPPPPPQKPTISEDTKTRVLSLTEKGAKLRTMTEQGIAFTPFKDQLAEVKSASETLSLVGWPPTWNHEQANFESAIEAWNLAIDIWEAKLRADRDPGDKLRFMLDVTKLYGARLQNLADLVSRRTNDQGVKEKLERITAKKDKDADGVIIPDWAIQWCFTAASTSFRQGS